MAKTALELQAAYNSQVAQFGYDSDRAHKFTQALESARRTEKERGYDIVSPKVQRKEKEMGSQYLTGADPKKDYKKYVQDNADLVQAYEDIQAGNNKQSEYWLRRMGGGTSMADFGRAHAGESSALTNNTYLGSTFISLFVG